MKHSIIQTGGWSNPDTQNIYENNYCDDKALQELSFHGSQCGSCSFFAAFDSDWGLCCFKKSKFHLETVFEHYVCAAYVRECWGPHSFTEDTDCNCVCEGYKDYRPADVDEDDSEA